jgi:pilus assembly protein CpaB
MNRRLTLILLVAFGIATVCTFLVYHLVRSRITASRPVAATHVVAARTDIKLGTILAAENLGSIEIVGVPPKGAILEANKGSLIGRGVISDLYEGEPIIDNRLAAPGMGGGLAASIPPGMRAAAVKVDEVVGVSGFATPGMRVDVEVSGTPPGSQDTTQGVQARTILQNIKVISAGTEYQPDKDNQGKPKEVQVVNLEVTPEQAQTLLLASSMRIQLVLRNPLDTKVTTVAGTATGNLFGGQAPAEPKAKRAAAPKSAEPPAFSIEVINGTKTSEEKFATPGGHQ